MAVMKARAAAAVGIVVALVFVYFVPLYYVPAVPPSGCNDSCASGGHGPYYASASYEAIGQGAMYWIGTPGTYELINTPFGSFG